MPAFHDHVLRNQRVGSSVSRGRLGSSIDDGDARENIVGGGLRVFDEDVEKSVAVEDAGVDELELGVEPRSRPVLVDEPRIGKLAVRVAVEHLHIRVRRQSVEEKVILLNVLAMIALAVCKSEKALFKDRILAVPHRYAKTQLLKPVADARDAVFTPTVGTGARLVVREVGPGGAVGAVIFAYRSPLPFAEVGSPAMPEGLGASLFEAVALGAHANDRIVAATSSGRSTIA